MFTIEERRQVRDWILDVGQHDRRISGGAITGSGALDAEDRFSDVDVAFAVISGDAMDGVLGDWTALLEQRYGVVHHFELRAGPAVYRVILLSTGLEVDIGLWPASQFGPAGAKFRLVFGERAQAPTPGAISLDHLIGLCWHHALHAHAAIAREHPWEAEYYISALRDHALEIACLRHGLPAVYARGTDELPGEVRQTFSAGLVQSLDATELRRALRSTTGGFLREVELANPELAVSLRDILHDIRSA